MAPSEVAARAFPALLASATFLRAAGLLPAAGLLAVVSLLSGCKGVLSEEATRELRAKPRPISLTIYPVQVLEERTIRPDAEAAKALSEFLRARGLAEAVVAEAPLAIPIVWGINEAKMYRRSAEAFGKEVVAREPSSDYSLLVEYLFGKKGATAGAVHIYVADRLGRIAEGTLLNSHQAAYEACVPVDPAACLRLTENVLERLLAKADPEG